MKTSDFYFDLDEKLIAQTPIENRDKSKLMVLNREDETIEHKHFYDIVDYLEENSTLVLNNTKVIPARLIGKKEDTKAVIELLLLKEYKKDQYEVLIKPARKIKEGSVVVFSNKLKAKCIKKHEEGLAEFELIYDGILYEILDELGSMPLPPYIKEKLEDKTRYNTVYSKHPGSSAAPTAGLHFTKEILEKINKKNIQIVYITLHVGLGTFRPVKVDNIKNHKMHEEYYEMSSEVAKILNNSKKIIAVGTTTVRTLETIYNKYNEFKEDKGYTDIFIYPGYEFKTIDHLITNFHLPESTLVMLVSAFSNKEFILKAYNEAVSNEYRFFSFGDSMLIL